MKADNPNDMHPAQTDDRAFDQLLTDCIMGMNGSELDAMCQSILFGDEPVEVDVVAVGDIWRLN